MPTPYIEKKPSSRNYYQEGVPQSVDIDNWRLQIIGMVSKPINLTYKNILELPQVVQSRRAVCVCNWSIRREWVGTKLENLLELVGLPAEVDNLYLKQTSIGNPEKGSYISTIPLRDFRSRSILLIHAVDGLPLSLEQGYPLRLIDFERYGYKGVKGLSSLEITDKYELGFWEQKAGYELDGIVVPKKYRIVDLQCWRFIENYGEVKGF